jgi:hypothetical protein
MSSEQHSQFAMSLASSRTKAALAAEASLFPPELRSFGPSVSYAAARIIDHLGRFVLSCSARALDRPRRSPPMAGGEKSDARKDANWVDEHRLCEADCTLCCVDDSNL